MCVPAAHHTTFISPTLDDTAHLHYLIPYIRRVLPDWVLRMAVDMFPGRSGVGRARNLIDTMSKKAEELYRAKKHALKSDGDDSAKQTGKAKDLISVLSA